MNTERFAAAASVSGRPAPLWRRPNLKASRRANLQVQGALSREKKEELVAGLVDKLQEAKFVFSLPVVGLTVAQTEKLRKGIKNADSSICVCKNTLLAKACDQVEGWEGLKEVAKGDNAWVFAKESQIAHTVKAWLDFDTEELVAYNGGRPKDQQVEHITYTRGGVLDGKLLKPEEVADLKDLPTMEELYAQIAMIILNVPTQMAALINQVPTSLALTLKQLSELSEDKDALLGDFVQETGEAEADAESGAE